MLTFEFVLVLRPPPHSSPFQGEEDRAASSPFPCKGEGRGGGLLPLVLRMTTKFEVNGKPVSVDVEPRMQLADCLRHDLRLTGTHIGCEHGVCGACTVLMNGRAARSCLTLAVQADGAIITVEGCPGRRASRCKVFRNTLRCSAATARRACSSRRMRCSPRSRTASGRGPGCVVRQHLPLHGYIGIVEAEGCSTPASITRSSAVGFRRGDARALIFFFRLVSPLDGGRGRHRLGRPAGRPARERRLPPLARRHAARAGPAKPLCWLKHDGVHSMSTTCSRGSSRAAH